MELKLYSLKRILEKCEETVKTNPMTEYLDFRIHVPGTHGYKILRIDLMVVSR